jgi:hypothetical protein
LGQLNRQELAELIRLLELARKPKKGPQAPVSCTGNPDPNSLAKK